MKQPGAKDFKEMIQRAGKSLHDDVAPLLAGAGFKLQLLRIDHPEIAPQISETLDTLEDAMDRVRKLSQELAPSPFTPPGA
jgi:signal transduction histidine kinase